MVLACAPPNTPLITRGGLRGCPVSPQVPHGSPHFSRGPVDAGFPDPGLPQAAAQLAEPTEHKYGDFLVDPEEVSRISGRSRANSGVDALYSQSGLDQEVQITPETLGMGASGPVKLGTRRLGGRRCAVKSLCKHGLPEDKLAEIKSEAETHLALDHPHLVRLERIYETASHVHLVLEHLEGGEVFDRLRASGKFEEKVAASTLRQMLRAVAYMHGRQVVHRDLKLENFLYEEVGGEHLKVIDLGYAARRDDEDGEFSRCCGTVEYVAPEVLRQEGYAENVDVWSMGILAYTMLCGRPPWVVDAQPSIDPMWWELFCGRSEENDTPEAQMVARMRRDTQLANLVKAGKPTFSKAFEPLSAEAKDFVRSLLVVDPRQRPTASWALNHPFLQPAGVATPCPDLRASIQAAAFSPLDRRACHAFVARFLPSKVEAPLREQFLSLAGDQGVATIASIAASIYSGSGNPKIAAEALLRAAGCNPGEGLQYSDFLGLVVEPQDLDDDTVHTAFALFDTGEEAEGHVQVRELRTRVFGKAGAEDLSLDACADSSGGLALSRLGDTLRRAASGEALASDASDSGSDSDDDTGSIVSSASSASEEPPAAPDAECKTQPLVCEIPVPTKVCEIPMPTKVSQKTVSGGDKYGMDMVFANIVGKDDKPETTATSAAINLAIAGRLIW